MDALFNRLTGLMLNHMVDRTGFSAGVRQAQFRSFAKKMPPYYASVVVMMLTVVYVFRPLAPSWLAVDIPAAGCILGTLRAFWWVRHAGDPVTEEQAAIYLKKATWTLLFAVAVIIGTDCKLFTFGDDHTRYFILIEMLASAMCGFYCLMHLRLAAYTIFAGVMIPFDALALSMQQSTVAMAASTATMAAGVMILAMGGYQQDFLNLLRAEAETLKLSEENLRLAHLDMLTGLPNRRHFFEALEQWTPDLQGPQAVAAVGMLDLDGFKPVNDTYGHVVGDGVLARIASRLESVSGQVEHLCRLGGDEFAFLVSARDEESLQQLGDSIIAAVSRPIKTSSKAISVGCSVGFALLPRQGHVERAALFEHADYALYHAKRSGRGKTVLFSEEHQRLIREQGSVEQALRGADLQAEFYLMFQPIVELNTGRTLCFECLARWNSPVLGQVSPMVFVPVAERTGLICDLTLVLLEKTLAAASTWPDEIGLAFNMSPNDIASYDQTVRMIDMILASGVNPARITMELTETALLHSFSETTAHMEMIRSIGASVALDDFGTGHSSLSYVHALPLDKIKIDRSFIQDLDHNPASRKIVRAVVTLCRDLGVTSVVEGVETDAQLRFLEELGATQTQGYYFSKPMGDAQAGVFLENTVHGCAVTAMPTVTVPPTLSRCSTSPNASPLQDSYQGLLVS